MKKTERWKIWLFGGILFAVAMGVNTFYDYQQRREFFAPQPARVVEPIAPPAPSARAVEPNREIQASPQKSPEELAAERARFIAKYVKEGISRTPSATTVFVAAADANGRLSGALATFLANHVASSSVRAHSAAFTSSFLGDGFLAEAFRDSTSVIKELDLDKVADVLLLARERAEIVRNDSSLANVLTAKTELEVIAIPVARPTEARTWTFSASGAGFNNSDALAAAAERIMKQITNGNTITLP